MKTLKKIGRFLLKLFLMLFIIFSILPYCVPIYDNEVKEGDKPFENSQFMQIDGKRWHYRIFSPLMAPKGQVLLIHGFSGSTFSWRYNYNALTEAGYRVLAIDLPAFGFSEKKNNRFDHSAHAHAEKIWHLIDSIGFDQENWNVVGHSMGAGIAWRVAGLQPQRSASVTLVDGGADHGKKGKSPSFLRFFLKYPPLLRWADVIAGSLYFKEEKFEELLTSAYSQSASKEAAQGYLRPFQLKFSARAVVEAVLYSKAMPAIDYSAVDCPVHLIWGTKDNWVPFSQAERFKIFFPQAKIHEIEGAGHCPMETHWKTFNPLLLGIVK
jgi:pimeloyl-ACP methyl ester carboxylesterase